MNTDIRNKLNTLDLMPLGIRETLPVRITKDSRPDFKILTTVPNYKELYNDFLDYDKNVKYLESRADIFLQHDIDVDEYKKYMDRLGFNKETYAVYPLRDSSGNCIVKKGSATKKFFKEWPTKLFRPQYNYTKSNWYAAEHIDHENYNIHGFRVLIPLNKASRMQVNGQYHVLEPGWAYFIDVTKPHAAWADKGRVVISMQMADDSLL